MGPGYKSNIVSARANSTGDSVCLVRRSIDSSSLLRSDRSRFGSWCPMSVCRTRHAAAISMTSSMQLWPQPAREIGAVTGGATPTGVCFYRPSD
jgi:hypothetical protein